MELQVSRWINGLALRLPAVALGFDKSAYLRRIRALTRSMRPSESIVREMRDDARF